MMNNKEEEEESEEENAGKRTGEDACNERETDESSQQTHTHKV